MTTKRAAQIGTEDWSKNVLHDRKWDIKTSEVEYMGKPYKFCLAEGGCFRVVSFFRLMATVKVSIILHNGDFYFCLLLAKSLFSNLYIHL